MKWHNKFIPTKYAKNIKSIDYKSLSEQGIKALFFDLDNTIISYDINIIPDEIKLFLEELSVVFKIVVVSNSRRKRVDLATSTLLDIPFVHFSRKPLKFGFKKALKIVNEQVENVALIGDQIMTDIYGGNRMKFREVILVFPVKKRSDHFFTRINRRIENRIIKKIKKKDPNKYLEVLKAYDESK